MEIIGDLIEQRPKTSWQEFIQDLRQKTAGSTDRKQAPVQGNSQSARDLEAKNWQEFLRQLARII